MRIDLADQVALVTGSAHRVGKAIAVELARCGVHILMHYNSSPEETVKETLREIKSFGVEAYPVQADVGSPEGVAAIFAALREHYDRLHILVNSASIFQRRALLDVTLEDWRQTMDVNLLGPFLTTQQAVPLMQRNPPPRDSLTRGVIINLCDRGALEPWPDYAHHGISKAGLLSLTRVTAASLGPDIRANAIIPGAVLKPPDYDDERWRKAAERTPMRRPGSAEDVARAVVYLASEDYLTGVALPVDGGEDLI